MAGFNPEPSSIGISRMLNRHVPRLMPSFGATVHPPAPMRQPTARIGRQTGGAIPNSPAAPFAGGIVHPGGGRTDDVPMHVGNGSYVLPADFVSSVGEGNTLNGLSILKMMFSPKPYGATAGPWGAQNFPMARGPGPPKAQQPRVVGFPRFQVGPGVAQNVVRPQMGQAQSQVQKFGGSVPDGPGATPIMASGGEFVIPPAEVRRRGGGDIAKGHRILDAWVKSVRKDHIKTLQKLPGPAR